jgi:hypothetical protein
MAGDTPTNEQWSGLYEAAIRIRELSPWEWMTEADVFGVKDPQTGETGFVSVMGMLGEHYAVALYPNPRALYGLLALEEARPDINPDALLEIPQIQLSFEDRDDLENRDRQLIKELGFKFRGRKEWPMFRSYRPGFVPWFVEAEEARLLVQALEQLLEVAPRFREDPSLLTPGGAEGESYLVRVASGEHRESAAPAGTSVWEDRVMEVPPPEPLPIEIEIDPEALESLERRPQGGYELEIDLFMSPTPIQENKEARPVLPYMLLFVEAESGMILGTELLDPTPSLEAMWGSVPLMVARQLARLEAIPREITVDSELLFALLQPLAESSPLELKRSHSLPALQAAKEALFEAFNA